MIMVYLYAVFTEKGNFIGKPSDFPPEVLLLLGVLLRGSGWGKSKDGSETLNFELF